MADPIQMALEFLQDLSHDPVLYSIVFFVYSVLAATVLPIPVEVGLFFSPETPVWVKALTLGAGKAVGAVLVFELGGALENPLDKFAQRFRFFRKFMELMRRFVAWAKYVGLYILLSIPLMVDTLPIYLFALFNKKGTLKLKWFALANFLGGITRAGVVYLIFYAFGLQLV